MKLLNKYPVFDSHLHIIDSYFPLIENNGYLPDEYTCEDYLQETAQYQLCGGAIVSGSFQVYDQGYLIQALQTLGEQFVGVTQLPLETTDQEIFSLNEVGVRAVRFNLKRGGSESLKNLSKMAARVYELVGWHVEIYVDASELENVFSSLAALPAVSIDHLGLSAAGLPTLLKLVEQGVYVKATGFSRVNFDVASVLRDIYRINPKALMFGTDLPSTRAPVRFSSTDFELVENTLGSAAAQNVFHDNAVALYHPDKVCEDQSLVV